jgi:hypothetical protein
MNFYEITSRDSYASYLELETKPGPKNLDGRICGDHRVAYPILAEYLGDPPVKPRKKGDFHQSGSSCYMDEKALDLFSRESKGNLKFIQITIRGREKENFFQVWVENFVDCLDRGRSVINKKTGIIPHQVGVIKTAIFDLERWDGSGLFVIPEDPSYNLYCSEIFLSEWKKSKMKGINFSRYFMDLDGPKF